jgi:formate hydrogenlyase subunit 3/multisubunit Na+/H+ antiporter MnhD subunit
MVAVSILYGGFPLSVKFIAELQVYLLLMDLNFFILLFIVVTANIIGGLSFTKVWLSILFGNKNAAALTPDDLTNKELSIIFLCFASLVLLLAVSYLLI